MIIYTSFIVHVDFCRFVGMKRLILREPTIKLLRLMFTEKDFVKPLHLRPSAYGKTMKKKKKWKLLPVSPSDN